MIYADFKTVLVPDNNVKQYADESYRNKYCNIFACSYLIETNIKTCCL